MRKLHCLLALALSGVSGNAVAGTVLLDTGYDNANSVYYGFGAQDDYWIKIASYEPPGSGTTTVPVARAFVVPPGGFFPLGNARWLSPRASNASTGGTGPSRPAYSLFRKCFCLLEGFANAQMAFSVRGDDNIQVWLNSVNNTLLAPAPGMLSSNPPRQYTSTGFPPKPQFFRTGRNCIYVLVEDNVQGGAIGFILSGAVTAAGIMPMPSTGLNGNFGPCGCPSEPNSAEGQGGALPIDHNEADHARTLPEEGTRPQNSLAATRDGLGSDAGGQR